MTVHIIPVSIEKNKIELFVLFKFLPEAGTLQHGHTQDFPISSFCTVLLIL